MGCTRRFYDIAEGTARSEERGEGVRGEGKGREVRAEGEGEGEGRHDISFALQST